MSDHQQWITIEEVINTYLSRSEQSIHKYFKCWNIAFDGMQQLGLDFFYQIKSVKLPVNSNLTVNLPPDYLNYSKIGVLNDVGEIVPLKYNDKLTYYAEYSTNRLQKTQDNRLFTLFQVNLPIWYNFWNGYTFQTLYGLPSGAPFVGSFKIDNTNGIILLDENYGYDYLIIEYVASPQEGGVYYVPMQFKEALMWFIAWNDISMLPNSRRGSLGDKEQRKKNYFNERRKAWARYRPLHLDEAYQWYLENMRMCIKS